MKLTRKLLGHLNRVFDKDPRQFLALRINYDADMTFLVEDLILTTSVSGGSGANLSVDISEMTIGDLVTHLNAQTGYSVPYHDSERSWVSCRALIDLESTPEASNGDHVYAHTSLLWVILTAAAIEIRAAQAMIVEMLKQMNLHTAVGMWVDEWGGYFGFGRRENEQDRDYADRIIAETLRLKSTNRAIEGRIDELTGYRVDILDLGFRDDFTKTNTAGDTTNTAGEITGPWNSATTHPTAAWLEDLGLTLPLYWGDPADGIYVHAAFAAIFGVDPDDIPPKDLLHIYRTIEGYRAAGTVCLYFKPVEGQLLRTNTADEFANAAGYLAGPKVPEYEYMGYIAGPIPEWSDGMLAVPGYGISGLMVPGFN